VVEVNYEWTFTSTGSGVRIDGFTVREWTFYTETGPNSTCTYEILSARSTALSAIGVVLGSSQTLGSTETRIMQFTGPFAAVWPRIVGLQNGGTVIVRGVAV
jgi:hypothetical protein